MILLFPAPSGAFHQLRDKKMGRESGKII